MENNETNSTNLFEHKSNILKRDMIIGGLVAMYNLKMIKIFLILAAIIFTYMQIGDKFEVYEIKQFLFVSTGLFLFNFLLIITSVTLIGILSTFTTMSKQGILGEHTYKFMKDEFIEKTDFNETRMKNQTISKVFTRFGTIYVQIAGVQYFFLPKRDFTSKEEKNKLYLYLKDRSTA